MSLRFGGNWWKLALTMVAASFALAACGANPDVLAGGASLAVDPSRGSLAPDFSLQTVSGQTVKLSELQGKPVLINFWATWCAPCRIEMPHIQAQADRYAGDLEVLLVDNNETAETVAAFMDELGLTMDPLLDPGAKVQQLYLIRGYPTTFFITEEGVIESIHIGIMTEGQLGGYLVDLGFDDAEKGD